MPIRVPPKGAAAENIPSGKGMIRRNGLRAVALSHEGAEGYRIIIALCDFCGGSYLGTAAFLKRRCKESYYEKNRFHRCRYCNNHPVQ